MVDAERPVIMSDFKSSLHKDAANVRLAIERHVKESVGLYRPTADFGCMTDTYNVLKNKIESDARKEISRDEAKKAKDSYEIKFTRLFKEIEELEKRNTQLKVKCFDL